jgi:hypothetical protein
MTATDPIELHKAHCADEQSVSRTITELERALQSVNETIVATQRTCRPEVEDNLLDSLVTLQRKFMDNMQVHAACWAWAG